MSLEMRKSTDTWAVSCASPASSSSVAFSFGSDSFCNSDDINSLDNSQYNGFSEDKELNNKFIPKKNNNLILYNSYSRLGLSSKAYRVKDCGSHLSFAHEIDEWGEISEKGKLHFANFCRDRLCPMCAWRRSYKIFGQVSQIMEQIHGQYLFLFLTLTVPNVKAEELPSALDHLLSSWNRFTGYKKIKKVVKGYFRALEITYNKKADSFHPHFHVVLAVPVGYLTSRDYIPRDEWLAMWQKACRDDSITQVDIRVCMDKYSEDELKAQNYLSSAVAEVAKYAVKDSDYLFAGDEALTDYLVQTFSDALHHRRLVQFGGIFKEIFKALNLEDVESDSVDLIHVNEKLNPALSWLICRYGWSMGTYKFIDTRIESPEQHKKN